MNLKQSCFNISSKDCRYNFSESLRKYINSSKKSHNEICVACIGTDRSTGDSLGPLIGDKIQKCNGIRVVGTLDNPLHAKNLNEFLSEINPETFVIAVDACLGKMDHVGRIVIQNGPIYPGSGVGKSLPPVGDVSITGIVNFGGFMDFLVLQNTRLSTVMKMANIISSGLKNTFKQKRCNKGRS